jgi:hypothetical protein
MRGSSEEPNEAISFLFQLVIIVTNGLPVQFGIPASTASTMAGAWQLEFHNSLIPTWTQVHLCEDDLSSINCSAPEMMHAFDASSAQPYDQVSSLIPQTTTGCAKAFQ